MENNSHPVGPVVASAHLAQSALPALSELEFALTMTGHAFQRWIERCMAAAGEDLSSLEVLILHQVAHRERVKTLADICLVLNIEDTHLANYAIRKLTAQGLVASGRRGKEKTISITDKGASLCRRYGEIREALLIPDARQQNVAALSELARILRALSGSYDQAARAAASL